MKVLAVLVVVLCAALSAEAIVVPTCAALHLCGACVGSPAGCDWCWNDAPSDVTNPLKWGECLGSGETPSGFACAGRSKCAYIPTWAIQRIDNRITLPENTMYAYMAGGLNKMTMKVRASIFVAYGGAFAGLSMSHFYLGLSQAFRDKTSFAPEDFALSMYHAGLGMMGILEYTSDPKTVCGFEEKTMFVAQKFTPFSNFNPVEETQSGEVVNVTLSMQSGLAKFHAYWTKDPKNSHSVKFPRMPDFVLKRDKFKWFVELDLSKYTWAKSPVTDGARLAIVFYMAATSVQFEQTAGQGDGSWSADGGATNFTFVGPLKFFDKTVSRDGTIKGFRREGVPAKIANVDVALVLSHFGNFGSVMKKVDAGFFSLCPNTGNFTNVDKIVWDPDFQLDATKAEDLVGGANVLTSILWLFALLMFFV